MTTEKVYTISDDLLNESISTLTSKVNTLFGGAKATPKEQPSTTQPTAQKPTAQKPTTPQTSSDTTTTSSDTTTTSSVDNKDIIGSLIDKLRVTDLWEEWKKYFNELLPKMPKYNKDIEKQVSNMYKYIPTINNPTQQFYNDIQNFLKDKILIPLQLPRSDVVIPDLLYFFKKSLEKYYEDKSKQIKESAELLPIHIDFTKANHLNESFLLMFGTAIKLILQRMFGQDVYLPKMSISGTPEQMETFIKTLAGEKRYFDSYVRYGLNDPRTYQDRYKLQASVNEFERNTGIKWPFK